MFGEVGEHAEVSGLVAKCATGEAGVKRAPKYRQGVRGDQTQARVALGGMNGSHAYDVTRAIKPRSYGKLLLKLRIRSVIFCRLAMSRPSSSRKFMPSNQSAGDPLVLKKSDGFALGLFMLVVIGAFGLLAFEASARRPLTRDPESYYALVTDAFFSGQLHLKVEPRSELLALSDPYNGALNQPYRLIDLSLYHGKYYFYWGLTPVVLLFAPLHFVTGLFPSEALACAFFGAAATGCMGWLLLALRRRHFPESSAVLTFFALICIASGSYLPALAMGNSVYGVPIAAAAFCQSLLWCCIACALHSRDSMLGWTVAAGIALGLAIGARPNYVLWSAVLVWPLVVLWLRNTGRRWILVVAAAGPPALTIAIMLGLNWLRFGRWLEFGMHYQLTGPAQPEVLFSWRNIITNFGVYGWNPPVFVRLFPFITTIATGPFGVFSALPVVFGIAGLFKFRLAPAAQVVTGTVGLAGMGGLLATCAFFGCGGRYQVDYLPGMVLAGVIGLLACSTRPAGFPRWATGGLAALLLLFSSIVSTALLFQLWGAQGERMLPLSRIFNRPVFWVDEMVGRKYGPVHLELTLPRNKAGAFEPIIVTGDGIQGGEMVFLTYVDDARVRIGFFQAGTTHWLSEPIAADYSRPHQLDVQLGALNPPSSHPVFSHHPLKLRKDADQVVKISWDGQIVYQTNLDFGMRHGERYLLGENSFWTGISGPRFTGKILAVKQQPFVLDSSKTSSTDYGAWRLRLRFPTDAKPGRYDPLLVSGITGAGDFCNVFYPAPGKVAFSHDAWGLGGSASATYTVDFSKDHLIEIDHGGLYPDPDASTTTPQWAEQSRRMRNRVRILLDGMVVLDAGDQVHRAAPETVTVGENLLGGSSTAARFSGDLISTEKIKK